MEQLFTQEGFLQEGNRAASAAWVFVGEAKGFASNMGERIQIVDGIY